MTGSSKQQLHGGASQDRQPLLENIDPVQPLLGNGTNDVSCGRSMSPSSPLSPSIVVTRPSSVALRASVAFALLSSSCGWVLSGVRISDVFRAVRVLPPREKPSREDLHQQQDACRAAPPWDANVSEMRDAVDSFVARDYVPPVWARNAHLHTIVASGDMEKKLLGDRAPLGYWRERWPTSDGDFVDIDWLPAEEPVNDEHREKTSGRFDTNTNQAAASAAAAAGVAAGAGDALFNGELEGIIDEGLDLQMTDDMEELREIAELAERAHGNDLGLGHPAAPEPVHDIDPSWMVERSKGKGGQGSGGTRRLVLVLHGLEGSSTAPLTKRFSKVYTKNGFDVAALNFRGCSGQLSKYPVGYHLGFTDDLLHVIEEIHRKFPDTWDRIYLSGFSLGGNVIVKFLGEQGDRARDLGIYGAAVGCVPFEPKIAAEKLEKDPIGRYVYTPIFMGWMSMKAAAHAKAFPEKLSLETVQNVKTFTQFNSHILSPVFDFSSADEFYEDVNASNYLSRVRVPLMVVNAKDDPFIDGDHLPEQERAAGAPVRLVYHTYGGHCGFMSGVLSKALQRKTPGRPRKWGGSPWGGSWVPSAWRDDPESVPEAPDAEYTPPDVDAVLHASGTPPSINGAPLKTEGGGSARDGVGGEGGNARQAAGGDAMVKEGRWLPTELARFVTHLEHSLHKDGRSERRGAGTSATGPRSCVVSK